MDVKHRNLLRDKAFQLNEFIDLNILMPFIMQLGIFTPLMLEDIFEIDDEFKKKSYFLKELETRGPHAFAKFLKALRMSGHKKALQLLLTNLPNYNSPCVQNNSSVLDESDLDTISRNPMNNAERYKITSNPSGYCLIINNVDFGDFGGTRKGSDLDAERLMIVFKYLGYNVQIERNLSEKDMVQILHSFSKKKDFENVDSCVVIILSHGDNGFVLGTDVGRLYIDDILDMFSNENCTALKEKPKLFFIQACRGKEWDYGVASTVSADSSLNGASKSEDVSEKRIPTFTDMLITYSSIQGYISLRDKVLGSWFCQALCSVFSQYACTLDLQSMLRKVDKQVKTFMSEKGNKQATENVLKGWDKQLYFKVTKDFPSDAVK